MPLLHPKISNLMTQTDVVLGSSQSGILIKHTTGSRRITRAMIRLLNSTVTVSGDNEFAVIT